MTSSPSSQAPAVPVFLDVELVPHRSLPPSGFLVLMLALGVVSFVAGIAFTLMGAWPVMGFFGLDVALVYVAFRLNYRSGRRREHIRLVEDELTVERVGVRGDRQAWQFQPYWLSVVLEERGEDWNRLTLRSHGRQVVVGGFLAPEERRTVAATLDAALARWRAHFSP